MATLQRLEIWSDFQCNAGARVAILPVDHVTRLTTTTRITRDDEGTLEISKDAAAAAHLETGVVLRWLFSDGSFDEWRVRELSDTSRASRTVTASLQSPLYDLNVGAAIISQTVDTVVDLSVEWKALTPAEVLAAILAFCPTWWAAGTVTPTIPVNLTTDAWMPLRALRELVGAIRGQGVACELDFRRNGTTGYYLDLVTTIGASASTIDVRTAKNLLSTTRQRDRQKYATEIVPVGASRSTMARAFLQVTAKSGSTLTVQAPETGGAVIAFEDQLDGLYLIDDANAKQLISNTAVSTQQFDVASAANVTVGRWYRLALNSSGDELIRIRKHAGTAGPIRTVESSSLDDATNFIRNPAMRTWTGLSSVPPDDWSSSGGFHTITRTTTAGLWLYGGKSTRIQISAGGVTQTLTSPTLTVLVPVWATDITYTMWVRLAVTGAFVNVNSLRAGGLRNATDIAAYALNEWHAVSFSESITSVIGTAVSFGMTLTAQGVGATTDLYVDAAQVTFTAAAHEFLEGSAATRLLTLGNAELTRYGTVPAAYSVQFADLAAWNEAAFPYDGVTLGATASVRDADLDVTTSGRVVELTRNWRAPVASAVTVANRPVDLITTLSGIAA